MHLAISRCVWKRTDFLSTWMWNTSPQKNSRSRCWEMWLRCMANMKNARYVAHFLSCSFIQCLLWQHSSLKPLGFGADLMAVVVVVVVLLLLLFWPEKWSLLFIYFDLIDLNGIGGIFNSHSNLATLESRRKFLKILMLRRIRIFRNGPQASFLKLPR